MKISIFGHSYVRDLQQLGNEYISLGSERAFLNYFAFPGSSYHTFLLNPNLLSSLIDSAPDVLVVILGGNDLKVNIDLNDVKSDCASLFRLLREKLPNVYIIAAQVEIRHSNRVNRHGSPAADLYRKLAVNFNKWLARQSFKNKLLLVNGKNKLYERSFFREDGVHLNSQGLNLYFDLLKFCILGIPALTNKL